MDACEEELLRLLAQRDAVDCAPFHAVAAALAAAQRRSDELDNRDSELASARAESEQLRGEVTRLQDACGQAGLRLRAASEVVKAQAARLSSATADIIGLRSELAESRALTATLGAEVRCPSMNADDPPVHRSADAAVFSWLRSDEQSKSRVMSWPSASRCVATCGVEARFSPRIASIAGQGGGRGATRAPTPGVCGPAEARLRRRCRRAGGEGFDSRARGGWRPQLHRSLSFSAIRAAAAAAAAGPAAAGCAATHAAWLRRGGDARNRLASCWRAARHRWRGRAHHGA